MASGSDGGTAVAPPQDRGATATTVDTDRNPSAEGSVPPVEPGDLLGDRYRIVKLIGQGGMGMVFVAEHTTIGKSVAIKVLGEDFAHRGALVERFLQEARAASSIRHPNIVDITDFGFVREGVPYFVMEFLEGKTLAERIEEQGRLPWVQARDIMLQVCSALQAAHDKGVIHRDMKPDNIFLIDRGDGRAFVKVLDFGIAKILTDGDKNLTRTGTVMGTAAYMSPEQAQSLPLDARTDLYAAGIVLYEMLTGRVPFDAGGFVGVLTKHVTERVPSMRTVAPDAGLSRALDRAVLRALHKDRRHRYASATELADTLRALGERGGARGWSRWAPIGLGAGLAVGVGAWTMLGDAAIERPSTPAAPPTGDVPPTASVRSAAGPRVGGDTGQTQVPAPSETSSATPLPNIADVADALESDGTTAAIFLPSPPAQDTDANSDPPLPGLDDDQDAAASNPALLPRPPDRDAADEFGTGTTGESATGARMTPTAAPLDGDHPPS